MREAHISSCRVGILAIIDGVKVGMIGTASSIQTDYEVDRFEMAGSQRTQSRYTGRRTVTIEFYDCEETIWEPGDVEAEQPQIGTVKALPAP